MKVYLLINDEGMYKIGITKNDTAKRIKQLQTGTHCEIRQVFEYVSDNARQIETVLHRAYKHKNVKREWFELTNEDVKGFKALCAKIDNNINIVTKF